MMSQLQDNIYFCIDTNTSTNFLGEKTHVALLFYFEISLRQVELSKTSFHLTKNLPPPKVSLKALKQRNFAPSAVRVQYFGIKKKVVDGTESVVQLAVTLFHRYSDGQDYSWVLFISGVKSVPVI